MPIVSFISRRRRKLALCGASVLLHLLALAWLAPQLGRAGGQASAGETDPVMARLIAPPPEPEPAAEMPKPAARSARKRAPPVRRPPAPQALPMVAGASESLPGSESGAGETVTDIQFVQAATVTPAPAVAAPVEAVAAAAEPPPAAHQYRVSMPPSARIVLNVERKDANGTMWHGEAAMAWKLSGDSYSMKLEAGIRLLVARVNLVVLESEGRIVDGGFAPVVMTEKRRGRAQTATHFGAQDARITFSASPASYALLPGTQDKATVPLQLAAIARGDSSQLGAGIEMLVGEDKDASVFRFVTLGQEEIDTGLGRMQTWHLSRPPRAGAYSSRLDIWLAPAYGWYPVRIKNIEANGAVTTQTVTKIEVAESGS
jgi:hypothetical protein